MRVPKDLRRIAKQYKRQGWEINPAGSGHAKWHCPDCGEVVTTTSSSPSNGHTVAKATTRILAKHSSGGGGMSTALDKRRLAKLAKEIASEVKAADTAWQSALGHAIAAGEKLTEAKGLVKHGEWLPWLEANFPADARPPRRTT